jgi:predicted 3-demethylubiquinone-9 3-methyltransferase (glyoxalase superfamily)
MSRPTPCLWYDGQAEAAANLYTSVFPRSEITDVSRTGPDGSGSVVMVGFRLDGQDFVALNGGPQHAFTEAVSFQIPCADQSEVDHYWHRLSDGGKEGQCGWLTDRFGLSWQVVPTRLPELLRDPDPERAHRVLQAMLQMQKIDIAELERAADGVAS